MESAPPAEETRRSMSSVNLERIVDCPFSLAVESAHVMFPLLESSRGGVRIPYRALGLPFPGAITHRVTVRFRRQPDTSEMGRPHDEIAFSWDAGSAWIPNLQGVLRFRSESSQTRIMLEAGYVPPFGLFGAMFDRLVGRRIALATIEDLLNRLALSLEARWTAERGR